MNKASLAGVSVGALVLLGSVFGASFAHAQVYTTSYTNPYNYSSACVQLTASMTVGTRDAYTAGQVTVLQSFLARIGYLPSTLITGYFGPITASDVARFQATRGIQPSGVVGPLTRAAIAQVSCGGTSVISPAQPIYPTSPVYPTNPSYPYGYNSFELNSLSANYQNGITTITLNGYGFDSYNTVNVGGTTVNNVSSSNGDQLLFTLPSGLNSGTYQITVSDSHGTSNPLSYTVSNTNNSSCGYVNGVYQCGCAYNGSNYYNNTSVYNNPCQTSSGVQISSLSASSLSSNTTLTIYGSGFSTNGNTVYFSGTPVTNVYSSNGTELTVTVPNINSNYNAGTYTVYVVNSNGQTSNSLSVTITPNGYNNNGSISISYVSPTSANPGSLVQIEGNGFSLNGNTVYFDGFATSGLQSFNNGTVLSFTVPNVTQGIYPLYVMNQSGQTSNSISLQAL